MTKGQEVKEAPVSLAEFNLELSIAWMEDAIRCLHEVVERLDKVRVSIRELREWYGERG